MNPKMAADQKTLNAIHEKLAEKLLAELDAEQVNPAVYGQIIKFLKDNNIEALSVPGSNLDKIKNKLHLLPFLEPHEREAVGE
jgi:hypothetical protein